MKIFFFLLLSWPVWAVDREAFEWASFERLAIQERGRFKPIHTFAEESVQFVTGSRRLGNQPSVETVLSWCLEFDEKWESRKFVRVSYGPLKMALGLFETEKLFSPEELKANERMRTILREIMRKQQMKEKLSDLENKAVSLQNQLGLLEAFRAGTVLTILPNPQGMDQPWFGIEGLRDDRLPYTSPQIQKAEDLFKAAFSAFVNDDASAWNARSPKLAEFLRNDLARGFYPADSELGREIHFNQLRPFRWAWVSYIVAFILLLVSQITQKAWATRAGGTAFAIAMALHSYGFILRCWISGRPPVTNMYETVIWVPWGSAVFSLAIWFFYRNLVIPTAATVFAAISLILADQLPTVLDPGIHPLEPVLRSNFWLTTHVLCITLSYSAFALSLCLGNVVLGTFLLRPKDQESIKTMILYMYRAMQIGVILVAAGTILGGVWADYSWGRFWGWDPKEVWALIVLLVYVAVLHGRMAGWLKSFGFVSATVFCFLAVLMAWYGVNFVLGVGLHSYGFGSGGLSYVMGYVVLQLAFVVAAWVRVRKAGAL